MGQGVGGFGVAFYYGWKMSLVVSVCAPFMGFAGYIMFVTFAKNTKEELDSYAEAGGIAEEVLGAIRTVTVQKIRLFKV